VSYTCRRMSIQRVLLPLLSILIALSLVLVPVQSTRAAADQAKVTSASELIQLVNQLRAVNGLPAYRVNNALMAAAQAHSDFQAETGNTSHTGKGGSRPRDRAVAYGYGSGAAVYVSENIATGTSLSAGEALGWWQGDSLHLNTMLSTSYRDAGAGVAEADGVVYYTLDVGYIAGEEGAPGQAQPPAAPHSQGGNQASSPAGTPVAVVMLVMAATPKADGSVIHEVQTGQALWNIAAIYQVSLSYLLTLNGLTENTLIYPGDKLLIRPPKATPTPGTSPTPARSASESATRKAAPTPLAAAQVITPPDSLAQAVDATQVAQAIPNATLGAGQTATDASRAVSQAIVSEGEAGDAGQDSDAARSPGIDPLLLLIAGLVVFGTLLLLVGSLMKRGG